jgi:hypothetical protein
MKRLLVLSCAVGLMLAALVSSPSSAKTCAASFCVDAQNTVNGASGGVTIGYYTVAEDWGRVTYNCYLGPIPLACNVYFQETFAYVPFAKPTFAAGNPIHIKSYVLGTSVVTGQTGWNYTDNGSITGDFSFTIVGDAKADTHTGTGTYYNGTGTGSGHMVDENYKQRVVVK